MKISRPEYPRPQFVRNQWLNLNGEWDFALDPSNCGLDEKWFKNPVFAGKIQVPFAFQSKLSGVEDKTPSDWCWYHRKFAVPSEMAGKQIYLHFGAVDYQCWVYVNEELAGTHEGGHTPFSFDITPYLHNLPEQSVTLRVYDPLTDETIPRGKQYWREKPESIWYTPTTGIWQTVWLEAVEKTHIKNVRFTTDFDNGSVLVEASLVGAYAAAEFSAAITFKGQPVVHSALSVTGSCAKITFDLFDERLGLPKDFDPVWRPENPNLFDVKLRLSTADTTDEVNSYFGMRKIHTENGKVFLNNRPYYQKLVLDQGYWPDGLLTAPTDDDLKKDILLAKEMGFNGCRKHQKVEDPRFLYWADKLGFLVWGECAAAQCFCNDAITRLTKEWIEIIDRDYNHPSIVTWVPYNESWGVSRANSNMQEQSHLNAMYYLIKSLDPTRLVVSNDGWEMTVTDIVSVHNYSHGHEHETAKYAAFKENIDTDEALTTTLHCGKNVFARGYSHQGQPILLTEFGGVSYKAGETAGWGYTTAQSPEHLLADLARIWDAIFSSKSLHGYCYTQLTDVEQEINGLLTYDRKPKCDLDKIRELNSLF